MSGGTRPRGVLQRRPPTMPDAPGPSPGPSPRLKLRPTVARRLAPLVVVSLAQLMIALDATIVSIALPSAQRALHVSDANRQLVITAYTLAFGGLLLLGGRIADYLGRKRAFLIGLAGFAAASALGGAATNLGMLLAGRALQGAFAAILAPTALSLLAVTFTEPAERARAFAVYGGIAGSGGAAGLLLGGVLTQYLVWRWCLYVNVPIAVIAAAGGWAALPDLRPSGRPRLDIPGALLATGSLAAVVYACTQAVSRRLGCAHRGRPLGGGRGRAGAVRGAGVPLGQPAAAAAHRGRPQPRWRVPGGGPCGRRYVRHVPAAHLLLPGRSAVLARAGGAGVPADDRGGRGQLRSHRQPPAAPRAATGHGIGCVFVQVFSLATQGVAPHDAGVASAMVNTANQVGGSIGTALLNTIAASATAGYLAAHARGSATAAAAQGLVHGYTVAIAWGAGILAAAALLATIMINAGRPPHPGDNARPPPRTRPPDSQTLHAIPKLEAQMLDPTDTRRQAGGTLPQPEPQVPTNFS